MGWIDNIILKTTNNMMLFNGPRNDDNKRTVRQGFYLIPNSICESENTSSIYAYVQVFKELDDWEYNNPIAEGYISLGSNNFIINNY